MTEQELREMVHKKVEEEVHPFIPELMHIVTEVFYKGVELGFDLAKKLP